MTSWGASRSLGPTSKQEKPVGNEFLTINEDAVSGSPLAISTSVVTLNVPDGCVEVILCGDVSFYYSEDSTMDPGGTTGYFTVPADTPIAIGVAGINTIYVKGSAACNLSISWVII